MQSAPGKKQVIIAPQVYVSLEPQGTFENQETRPRRAKIPMVWTQDGDSFRLDIDLPESSALDVTFSTPLASLHVNGETIWANDTSPAAQVSGTHVEATPEGLRLSCTACGSLHILALGAARA